MLFKNSQCNTLALMWSQQPLPTVYNSYSCDPLLTLLVFSVRYIHCTLNNVIGLLLFTLGSHTSRAGLPRTSEKSHALHYSDSY